MHTRLLDIGMDVDQGFSEGVEDDRCFYIVLDSRDKLNLSITPEALDVVEEIVEVISRLNTIIDYHFNADFYCMVLFENV